MKTRLYRNVTGTVIHAHDCPRMSPTAVPWTWADGKTREQVVAVVNEFRYQQCSVCLPLSTGRS